MGYELHITRRKDWADDEGPEITLAEWLALVADDPELQRLLDAVQRRELDPLTAVREILEKVFHIESNERDDNSTRTS